MKNIKLLVVAMVVAMFAISCQQFNENRLLLKGKARFVACTEETARTTMGENYSVVWSEGDQIKMFGVKDGQAVSALQPYTLIEGAGTTNGLFEGELDQVYDSYYALYPVSMFYEAYSNGVLEIDVPVEGNIFAELNFVDGANPMVAVGDKDNGLQFHNIFGILELRVKGAGTLESIVIEDVGTPNGVLAGRFLVSVATLEVVPNGGSARIAAQFASPLVLSESDARSIYAVLPSGEYKQLKVTTIDSAGNSTTRIASFPITIERSKITSVKEFLHKVNGQLENPNENPETGW